MKFKIVPKNSLISEEAIANYTIAKNKCGNSIVLESAMLKISRIRYALIDIGYGITIVTTYSLLADIIGSHKMIDIAENARSIKPEDVINAAKRNKSVYSILEVA